ncbi:MAG TPA: hypothetical protein VNP72_07370, partial [Longimicrobium sp.]|nr:hypothetical protein [Longimicrobium sp.]
AGERITIRMTGCPNGCARPYTADIAFVGRSLGKYMLYVGGNSQGTRLATPYQDLVPAASVVETLRPLFLRFREERQPGEPFGDFCNRVGVESLRSAEAAA